METRRAVLTLGDLLEEKALDLALRTGPAEAAARPVLGAAVVEVESPARWIAPEWVLLTAGVRLEGDSDGALRALVAECDEARIAALGFGVGPVFDELPDALLEEGEARGYPIFAVPFDTPFREVIRFVDTAIMGAAAPLFHRLSSLQRSDLWGPPLRLGGRLIRVDLDPGQLHKNAAADVALAGDARPVLEGLLAALPARAAAGEDLAGARDAIRAEALADGAPYLALVGALDEALGPEGVLSGDSTMAAYYGAVHFLPLHGARRFIYPTGYATLGYALPAAIGAKLAAPERPVIALVGDGGLLFTVAELATAAELGIPLPVVVPNNGGYGEIKAQMLDEGIDPIGVDLRVPDLPLLGEAFGGAGVRVDDPAALAPALRDALARPGPTLIEVPMP